VRSHPRRYRQADRPAVLRNSDASARDGLGQTLRSVSILWSERVWSDVCQLKGVFIHKILKSLPKLQIFVGDEAWNWLGPHVLGDLPPGLVELHARGCKVPSSRTSQDPDNISQLCRAVVEGRMPKLQRLVVTMFEDHYHEDKLQKLGTLCFSKGIRISVNGDDYGCVASCWILAGLMRLLGVRRGLIERRRLQ
jgi:hypothetical protein